MFLIVSSSRIGDRRQHTDVWRARDVGRCGANSVNRTNGNERSTRVIFTLTPDRSRVALMFLLVVLMSLTFALAADNVAAPQASDENNPAAAPAAAATRPAHPDTPAWRAFE